MFLYTHLCLERGDSERCCKLCLRNSKQRILEGGYPTIKCQSGPKQTYYFKGNQSASWLMKLAYFCPRDEIARRSKLSFSNFFQNCMFLNSCFSKKHAFLKKKLEKISYGFLAISTWGQEYANFISLLFDWPPSETDRFNMGQFWRIEDSKAKLNFLWSPPSLPHSRHRRYVNLINVKKNPGFPRKHRVTQILETSLPFLAAAGGCSSNNKSFCVRSAREKGTRLMQKKKKKWRKNCKVMDKLRDSLWKKVKVKWRDHTRTRRNRNT